MKVIKNYWKHQSIAHKLNLVVGVMAILIVGQLFTLHFAMTKLSAARALVGGESLWSKAQKDAVYSLHTYEITHDERDFREFLTYLKVTDGGHQARIELYKKNPDLEVIREQGRSFDGRAEN